MIYEVRIASGEERITVLLEAKDEAAARERAPLIAFHRLATPDETIEILVNPEGARFTRA